MPEAPARWQRHPDVAVVDSGTRVVALVLADPSVARPLVLEGPAAAVWHALETPRTTEEVVSDVSADFGIPAAEVEHDVATFLSELEVSGLVRRADPDTARPSSPEPRGPATGAPR